MKQYTEPLAFHHGTVYLNGEPVVFISADYPYYRDNAANWQDRLEKLVKMNVPVVSIYIPWRHHQPDLSQEPDFTGRSQANRNVLGFLALCNKLGLAVIAKPGPFIHGETNYGGLPDWVCPSNNPQIEPLVDAQENDCTWIGAKLKPDGSGVESWPLPAPFSSEFLRLTRNWMKCVSANVIMPNEAPGGPIVAVQIGNEGIYSNGQHAPWAYDYSDSAIHLFHQYLQSEHQSLAAYNKIHRVVVDHWNQITPPKSSGISRDIHENRTMIEWGKFQAWYMDQIFTEWASPLGTDLPVLINQNPPLDTSYGLDAWLTRVEPEAWRNVIYGFTNWVGDVSARPTAFTRYILTAKRFPGVNMEENWGFAELYDPAYIDAATSFYQTLVILNAGATGFNIYTGVGTGFQDTNLEVLPKVPYPDASPISHEGIFTAKATIAQWMIRFFDVHGSEFLACKPEEAAAWGLYLPAARLAVWSPPDLNSAPVYGHILSQFQNQMRDLHLDYGVVNLETASQSAISQYKHMFIAGSQFMAADVQAKLADFVSQGGKLIVVGALPTLDENFNPCASMADVASAIEVVEKLELPKLFGKMVFREGLSQPVIKSGSADVWLRSLPQKDIHYLTILIPSDGNAWVDLSLKVGSKMHTIQLNAAPSAGAILRIENGAVSSLIIKGYNGFLGQAVVPTCIFDQTTLGSDQPGDYFQIDDWAEFLEAEK